MPPNWCSTSSRLPPCSLQTIVREQWTHNSVVRSTPNTIVIGVDLILLLLRNKVNLETRKVRDASLFTILIQLHRPSVLFLDLKNGFILEIDPRLLPHKEKSRRHHQADKGGLFIIESSPTIRSNSFVISINRQVWIMKVELWKQILSETFKRWINSFFERARLSTYELWSKSLFSSFIIHPSYLPHAVSGNSMVSFSKGARTWFLLSRPIIPASSSILTSS